MSQQHKRIIVAVSTLLTMLTIAHAMPRSPILLVLPARHHPLQLAFDMRDMRPTTLVAYEQDRRSGRLALHMWHEFSEKWVMLSLDDIKHGDFLLRAPRSAYIVGENAPPPPALVEAISIHTEVTIVDSMQIADLVNELRSAYKFRRNEWYWLSSRYEFDINDLNEAVRRFNPYDIPASEVPKELPEIEYYDDDIPPAVMERRTAP